MKNIPKRACIYPKDIQCITGKSYRQSLRMIKQIKKVFNKEKEHLITIEEFCQHTGLQYEVVAHLIVG